MASLKRWCSSREYGNMTGYGEGEYHRLTLNGIQFYWPGFTGCPEIDERFGTGGHFPARDCGTNEIVSGPAPRAPDRVRWSHDPT